MRSGAYCEKHGEFSESGICRWCEPPAVDTAAVIRRTVDSIIAPPVKTAPWGLGPIIPVPYSEIGRPFVVPIILHYPTCNAARMGMACNCAAIAAANAGKP